MQPVVIYPDAELVVIDYLRSKLATRSEPFVTGVLLGNKVPSPRAARFVRVRRNGGVESAPTVDRPRIDVECWAQTDGDAADLSALCRALIRSMQNVTPVRRVDDFLGPTPIPDPESNQPRYLFTVEISMRGTPLEL